MPDKLIAVAKTSSRDSSLRITLPKEIAEKLKVSKSEHIRSYEVRGKLWLGMLNKTINFLFYGEII